MGLLIIETPFGTIMMLVEVERAPIVTPPPSEPIHFQTGEGNGWDYIDTTPGDN